MDLKIIGDGIGLTTATASPLPTTGNTINFSLDKGVITPTVAGGENPIGIDNHSKDFFSFLSTGLPISLTVNDGSDYLAPGFPDGGATHRSVLDIFSAFGTQVAKGTSFIDILELVKVQISAGPPRK